MGMYDSLICLANLPLNEELSSLPINWTGLAFQTKCLDNSLSSFVISKEGEFFEEVVEHEYVEYSEEELKSIKPKPWNIFKEINVKNKYSLKREYHGAIVFYDVINYSDAEDIWVEFEAIFSYGKLDKIILVKSEHIKSQKLHTIEFATRQAEEDKKLWNRFKGAVRPLGWRRFWLFMAHQCNKLIEVFGKIQSFIYRKLI